MEKLASFIKAKGMTQAAFADRVGVSQGTLSKLCKGTKGLSLATALAIEKETGGTIAVADWPKFSALAQRLGKSKRTRIGKPLAVDVLPDGVSVLATNGDGAADCAQVSDTRPSGAA